MKILLALLFLILILQSHTKANDYEYLLPVDIRVVLSSNFGELRKNHFHAGLDFKTFGKTGYALRSIESGFVARIKISSDGYGKVVYINHPTGHTSVYAHLEKFSPKIEQFIRQKQLALKQNEPELYLMPGFFEIEKGEIIGFSGNSGRSDGPHLHFEIRNTQTEHPLNALQFYPQILDNIAPTASQLIIYEFSEEASNNAPQQKSFVPLYLTKNGTYQPKTDVVIVNKHFSIAVAALDRMANSPNVFGIYRLKLFVDKKLHSEIAFDSVSFLNSRGINAFLDYEMFVNHHQKFYSFYQSPNNDLFVYQYQQNRGLISIADDNLHLVEIFLEDFSGNKTVLEVKFRAIKKTFSSGDFFSFQRPLRYHSGDFYAELPSYSLFFDEQIVFEKLSQSYSAWSETFSIGKRTIPLKMPVLMRFLLKNMPQEWQKKAFVQLLQPDGKKTAIFGNIYDNFLEAQSAEFGVFYVEIDNEAPELSYVGKIEGLNDIEFRFRAKDRKTYIKEYAAYLDDEWKIAYLDKKNGIISVKLNRKDLLSAQSLKMVVFDRLNNIAGETVKIY